MESFPTTLLDGYQAFKSGRLAKERERYRSLAEEGQSPETLVIACCDSRAAPEMIFDARPGELFVVRNVANLVPPFNPGGQRLSTSAALEFAVQALKVRHIVIMGHGRCGGIKAALDPSGTHLSPGDFIDSWMELLAPAAKTIAEKSGMTEAERQTALERLSVRHSIENLRSFPFVSSLENEGRLQLHGAWFDIAEGELWVMNSETGDFTRPEA